MKKSTVFFLLLSTILYAQDPKKSIYISEIFENASTSNEESLEFRNMTILTRGIMENLEKVIIERVGIENLNLTEDSLITIKPKLTFLNCTFEFDGAGPMAMQNLRINGFYFAQGIQISLSDFKIFDISFFGIKSKSFDFFSNTNLDMLSISKSTISSSFNFWNNDDTRIRLESNEFHRKVRLDVGGKSSITLSKNIFHPYLRECPFKMDSLYTLVTNTQLSVLTDSESSILSLRENIFQGDYKNHRVNIGGNWTDVELIGNTINSLLSFNHATIGSRFEMIDNILNGKISFNDCVFPEIFNLMRWNQFDGLKLVVFEIKPKGFEIDFMDVMVKYPECLDFGEIGIIYSGKESWEVSDSNLFEKLIYNYQSLFNIYKLRGDIESANACFAEMRDIQIRYLEQSYNENKSFKLYFRWKISQLLKVYTNHGTDPALAIVVSMYVILAFSVFYFFFPSEWDTTSKARLISNFKDFRQKNDKGYIKPFFVMLAGFAISLINALTLSLNSFVTLGFGTIPTTGLARYVCIIQGFIGWFLLSLFTVALINQVLA